MTEVSRATFGVVDGRTVRRWVLADGPVEVALLDYGATIQSLVVPDATGTRADVVLGFDTLDGYVGEHPYLGATVGRFANRIAGGRFVLDGVEHRLPVNNGPNTLHGGVPGFSRRVWDAEPVEDGVRFTLTSPDGESGFPGAVTAAVTVTLRGATVRLAYEAQTDAPTVVNLTNHAYLHLGGVDAAGTIEEHVLEVAASRYLPADADLVPTGEPAPVAGTPLDFTAPRPVGARLREGHEQLVRAQGYDHCFVLDRAPGEPLSRAARLADPASGRVLEVWTDQPAIQVYSGNFLDATLVGKGGRTYRQSDGLCLETQGFPDAPNRPAFPSSVLRPGGRYATTTELRFGRGAGQPSAA